MDDFYGVHSPVYIEAASSPSEKALNLINNSQYFGLQHGSPCIITISGVCTNPSWTIVQNGNVVGTDGFKLTMASNQKLIVSSYPENQYARIYNEDASYSDVSQLQDYAKTNFIMIPEGQSTLLAYVGKTVDFNLVFKEERLLV